jgi:hypothetical protein
MSLITTLGNNVTDCVWNVMAHAQKPDFVFQRKGRVHLNRRGRQFIRLLAADVCASAVVMLDATLLRGSVKSEGYWIPTTFARFPFTSPPVRHREQSHFNWTLPISIVTIEYGLRNAIYVAHVEWGMYFMRLFTNYFENVISVSLLKQYVVLWCV